MSFPIRLHQDNGHYVAALVGAPDLRVTAPTREGAIAQMQAVLEERFAQGELVFLEVPSDGFMSLAGKYKDDESLAEICDEIYRQRDAEPKE